MSNIITSMSQNNKMNSFAPNNNAGTSIQAINTEHLNANEPGSFKTNDYDIESSSKGNPIENFFSVLIDPTYDYNTNPNAKRDNLISTLDKMPRDSNGYYNDGNWSININGLRDYLYSSNSFDDVNKYIEKIDSIDINAATQDTNIPNTSTFENEDIAYIDNEIKAYNYFLEETSKTLEALEIYGKEYFPDGRMNMNANTPFSSMQGVYFQMQSNPSKYSQSNIDEMRKKLDDIITRNSGGKYTSYDVWLNDLKSAKISKEYIEKTINDLEKEKRILVYNSYTKTEEYKNYSVPTPVFDDSPEDLFMPEIMIGESSNIIVTDFSNIKANKEYIERTLGAEVINSFPIDLDIDYTKLYHYIKEKEGADAATRFVNDINDDINCLNGLANASDFCKNMTYGAIGDVEVHLKGIGCGVTNSLEGISAWLSSNPEKTVNYYEVLWITQFLATGKYGKFQGFNFEVGQSIGNMLPSVVMSQINPYLGATYLTLSSGGNKYRELRWNGYDVDKARFLGLLSGCSEALTERLLGGLPFLSEVEVTNFKTWILAAVREGNQEVIQDFVDSILFGEEFTIDQAIHTWIIAAITSGEMQGVPLLASIGISDVISRSQVVIDGNLLGIHCGDEEIIIDTSKVKNYLKEHPNVTPQELLSDHLEDLIASPTKTSDIELPDGKTKQLDAVIAELGDNGRRKLILYSRGIKKDIPDSVITMLDGINEQDIRNYLGLEDKLDIGIQFFGNPSSIYQAMSLIMQDIDNRYGKGTANRALRAYLQGGGDLSVFAGTNFENMINKLEHHSLIGFYNRAVTNYSASGTYVDHTYIVNQASLNNLIDELQSRGDELANELSPFTGRTLNSGDLVNLKTILQKWYGPSSAGDKMRQIIRVNDYSEQVVTYNSTPSSDGGDPYAHFLGLMKNYDLQHGQGSAIQALYKTLNGSTFSMGKLEKGELRTLVKKMDSSTINDYYSRILRNYNFTGNYDDSVNTMSRTNGYQLTHNDLGAFFDVQISSGRITPKQVRDMMQKVNNTGYCDANLGNYLKQIVNNENYTIYVKKVHSSDVPSIMHEGIRCLGTTTSGAGLGPRTVNEIGLENVAFEISDGSLYDVLFHLKSSNGISPGLNPIDGAIIFALPKNADYSSLFKWSERGQCYVINPIYNIGFVGCDKYGNLDGSKLIGYNPNQNANRSGYYTK